jgi:membrane-bound lytic murein transglycosylase B
MPVPSAPPRESAPDADRALCAVGLFLPLGDGGGLGRRSLAVLACLPVLALAAGAACAKPHQHTAAKHARARSAPVAPPRVSQVAPDELRPAYAERAEVRAFAVEVAQRHPELGVDVILSALAQASYQPAVARLIMPAAHEGARDWAAYRARMVDPTRVRAGLNFLNDHRAWLALAQQRYGVPPEVVVGIIGIETLYGRQTGGFKALDALATLSFDFPTGRSDRSAFFREELEALLVLSARQGSDVTRLKSSYAGALGLPQFMPSSWLKYAVDLDGDGRIDLHGSPADAIGSVAHYLAEAGWQAGLPAVYAVTPPDDAAALALLRQPDILPSFTAAEMLRQGAQLDAAGSRHPGLLALIELRNGLQAPPTYVAGSENFWAITRYNWSAYYAMAVLDLAQTISSVDAAQQRAAGGAGNTP